MVKDAFEKGSEALVVQRVLRTWYSLKQKVKTQRPIPLVLNLIRWGMC